MDVEAVMQGSAMGGTLTYAAPRHPQCRRYHLEASGGPLIADLEEAA